MFQLLGRLHPLVVHLPVGILLLGYLFEILTLAKQFKKLKAAIPIILLVGTLSAVFACMTGYLLSQEGGYTDRILLRHQILGITTAAVSLLFIFIRKAIYWRDKSNRKRAHVVIFTTIIILLSVTGHLGGSLTHGEEYLLEFYQDPSSSTSSVINLGEAALTDSAVLFRDVVYPILEAKCLSCHSSRKQKGELRLDGVAQILKGGKHGDVLRVGLPDSSALYRRLTLPLEDEHHMPPNEKSQLSSAAIDAIHLWVKTGYDFEQLVSAYKERDYLTKVIATIKTDEVPSFSWVPSEDVKPADPVKVSQLEARDILILPVARQSNYLKANFVNVKTFTSSDLDLLLAIKDQLVWLDLSNSAISDDDAKKLGQLDNLRYLYLRNCNITDSCVIELKSIPNLQYVNLSDTKITAKGIEALLNANHVRELYVHNSQASSAELKSIVLGFPNIYVDTGGYKLPALATDTIVYH